MQKPSSRPPPAPPGDDSHRKAEASTGLSPSASASRGSNRPPRHRSTSQGRHQNRIREVSPTHRMPQPASLSDVGKPKSHPSIPPQKNLARLVSRGRIREASPTHRTPHRPLPRQAEAPPGHPAAENLAATASKRVREASPTHRTPTPPRTTPGTQCKAPMPASSPRHRRPTPGCSSSSISSRSASRPSASPAASKTSTASMGSMRKPSSRPPPAPPGNDSHRKAGARAGRTARRLRSGIRRASPTHRRPHDLSPSASASRSLIRPSHHRSTSQGRHQNRIREASPTHRRPQPASLPRQQDQGSIPNA